MSALRFVVPMIFAAGVGVAVAAAPTAAAEPPNPLLPQCEVTGGSSVEGGQTTDCASPGNVQIDATPPEPGYGMFPWDDEFFVL
ncbi:MULTISPECIES: hypothetical protein [unclassified Mycolicibacterium]|jgi:hypothetical protein|uniref:hypothetical protein n=1 Tax=unclassified Mycolicibacterium TaxID=2636767 RepID=UPI001F4BFCF1|nr:hypothetical protein [Mycolicibacterium sp. YH-1]UNB53832.1 hypothetical protein L0M16_05645 [Mycolicibacterium sp. YH-1]HET7742805.1 hypothetical protein [Mycobacterium sp.]